MMSLKSADALVVRVGRPNSDDPSRVMMRQIAGSFAEYENARLVSKLKGARERKRAAVGKCEGSKSHAELRPDVVALVAAELAQRGHLNEQGRPVSAASV
jgi:DNA invertase Pin-like site-specific DNA recombinase